MLNPQALVDDILHYIAFCGLGGVALEKVPQFAQSPKKLKPLIWAWLRQEQDKIECVVDDERVEMQPLLGSMDAKFKIRCLGSYQWPLLAKIRSDELPNLGEYLVAIILVVSQAREKGLTSIQICEAAKQDNRCLTGRLATLIDRKIIVRHYPVFGDDPVYLHREFASAIVAMEENNPDTLRSAIVEVVKNSHNQIRSLEDITHQFKIERIHAKRFHTQIRRLVRFNYLKKVKAPFSENAKPVSCLMYLKDYDADLDDDDEDIDTEDTMLADEGEGEGDDGDTAAADVPVLAEESPKVANINTIFTLQSQVQRLLLAKNEGVQSIALMRTILLASSSKVFYNQLLPYVKSCPKKPIFVRKQLSPDTFYLDSQIVGAADFAGKSKVIRYFPYKVFKKNTTFIESDLQFYSDIFSASIPTLALQEIESLSDHSFPNYYKIYKVLDTGKKKLQWGNQALDPEYYFEYDQKQKKKDNRGRPKGSATGSGKRGRPRKPKVVGDKPSSRPRGRPKKVIPKKRAIDEVEGTSSSIETEIGREIEKELQRIDKQESQESAISETVKLSEILERAQVDENCQIVKSSGGNNNTDNNMSDVNEQPADGNKTIVAERDVMSNEAKRSDNAEKNAGTNSETENDIDIEDMDASSKGADDKEAGNGKEREEEKVNGKQNEKEKENVHDADITMETEAGTAPADPESKKLSESVEDKENQETKRSVSLESSQKSPPTQNVLPATISRLSGNDSSNAKHRKTLRMQQFLSRQRQDSPSIEYTWKSSNRAMDSLMREARTEQILAVLEQEGGYSFIGLSFLHKLRERLNMSGIDRRTLLRDIEYLEEEKKVKIDTYYFRQKLPFATKVFYFVDKPPTEEQIEDIKSTVLHRSYELKHAEVVDKRVRLYTITKRDRKKENELKAKKRQMQREERQNESDTRRRRLNQAKVESIERNQGYRAKKKKAVKAATSQLSGSLEKETEQTNVGVDGNSTQRSQRTQEPIRKKRYRRKIFKLCNEDRVKLFKCVIISRSLNKERSIDYHMISEFIEDPNVTAEIVHRTWSSIRNAVGQKLLRNINEEWAAALLKSIRNKVITKSMLLSPNLGDFLKIWDSEKITDFSQVDSDLNAEARIGKDKDSDIRIRIYESQKWNADKYVFVPDENPRVVKEWDDIFFAPNVALIQKEHALLQRSFVISEDSIKSSQLVIQEVNQMVKAILLSDPSTYSKEDVTSMIQSRGFDEEKMAEVIKEMSSNKNILVSHDQIVVNEKLFSGPLDKSVFDEAGKFNVFMDNVLDSGRGVLLSQILCSGYVAALIEGFHKKRLSILRIQGYSKDLETVYTVKMIPEEVYSSGFLVTGIAGSEAKKRPIPVGGPCSRVWIDITGKINVKVFNSVVCAVISTIWSRPAIPQGRLFGKLSRVISYSEFKEVLEWLEECGKIKKAEGGYFVDRWIC